MSDEPDRLPSKSSRREIDEFLAKAAAMPAGKQSGERGRLVFAMDATASREPTWDRACEIQAQMFSQTASIGGLDVQLCYYRGFREFYASIWADSAAQLLGEMTGVRCAGGATQIARVLDHTMAQTRKRRIHALVFVGDCMEESIDKLCQKAGELGLLGVPAFMFHEGFESTAERAFRDIARLTSGAYCRFDAGSADQLRDLLSAVAVYAAGGRKALTQFGERTGGVALKLSHQLRDS